MSKKSKKLKRDYSRMQEGNRRWRKRHALKNKGLWGRFLIWLLYRPLTSKSVPEKKTEYRSGMSRYL